jgi:hypothetical protein
VISITLAADRIRADKDAQGVCKGFSAAWPSPEKVILLQLTIKVDHFFWGGPQELNGMHE